MAGPFAPGNESSCELSLPGNLVPGTFPPLIQDIAMQYATYSRLVAVPLLPAKHIQPAFNNFCDSLPDDVDGCVTALVTYVNDNWISSRLRPPSSRCAFQSSIRTNNDVEGWHIWLYQTSRHGKLDFYHLRPWCTGRRNASPSRQSLCPKTACIATRRRPTNRRKDCSASTGRAMLLERSRWPSYWENVATYTRLCSWLVGRYFWSDSRRWDKHYGNQISKERKFQGAKWQGSEWARVGSERAKEQIGQGPIGQFAPGSELAWERKGSVPCKTNGMISNLENTH